ncbi:MAG: 5'-3' exonuclease H3TH domain-containing protein, partial [Bacteroidota bacterium]
MSTTPANTPPPKLFLLDAMALIYRAHFALSKTPRITSTGLNTSATFGFVNTMLEILTKEKPTHIGVAFDAHGPTFRHTEFEAYKAGRQEMPEDIGTAIPYVQKIVEAFNIPMLIMPGYEADDIIGSMAKKAEVMGFNVFMMTPDKDYCQLVSENVFVYRPAFLGRPAETLGIPEVLAKWEITRIDQVRDILGLQGDAVDNIPGIPGIGEVTAKKLIAQFDSVENLIANADQLKGKQKENVINFAQQGLMSKQLATIHCDVPGIDFDPEHFRYKEPNRDALRILFDELEFRTITKRVLGEEGGKTAPASGANFNGTSSATSAAPKTASKSSAKAAALKAQPGLFDAPAQDSTPEETAETLAEAAVPVGTARQNLHNSLRRYHLIDTQQSRQSLADYLMQVPEFCFDTETDSLESITANLVGMSFSWYHGEAYYVPVPAEREAAQA